MKRTQIGDIIEIPTPVGLVYAQFTHYHREYGNLLRVYLKKYAERPRDLSEILKGEIQFMCFIPLQAAVKFRMVNVIGRHPLPAESSTFPLFRSGIEDPTTLKVKTWWLWDGERSWRVGEITAEQRRYPMREIWNHEFLVDRIVEGWRAETDPR